MDGGLRRMGRVHPREDPGEAAELAHRPVVADDGVSGRGVRLELAVGLEPTEGGTRVTVGHTDIPEGQGESYEGGWNDFYFDPMERYFGSTGAKLQDASDALEEAAQRAGEAVEETAGDGAGQLDEAAKKAIAVVASAKKGAQRQALKAVKTAKGVQAKAVKGAKKVAKQVKALVKAGAKKKAPAKKAAAKKAAPKKKTAKKSRR